jgi:hypothetical protein
MTQIGFDSQAVGFQPGHMQRADVSGPGGDNALPAMMRRRVLAQSGTKVVCLADVYRLSLTASERFAKNVDAGAGMVDDPECGILKFIGSSARSSPAD